MGLHTRCTDTERESALKVDSGRKVPCCTGDGTCVDGVPVRCSSNRATSPPMESEPGKEEGIDWGGEVLKLEQCSADRGSQFGDD